MGWDPVPYFTGFAGASHSPEVFRTALYAATGGVEGVVAYSDLKVVPTDVPSSSVRVSSGGLLALARATGGSEQTYASRLPDFDTATLTATGSSGGRSDLIVAVVRDPSLPGQNLDDPADAADGPYMFTDVIPGVPSTTTRLQDVAGHANDTGIALARIDLPASTGTVTAAMITDLRTIARPRSQRKIDQYSVTNVNYKLTNASKVPFPQYQIGTVTIPPWAYKAHMMLQIVGIYVTTGPVAGYLEARIGPDGGTQIATRATYYNEQSSNDSRHTYIIADDVVIPASMTGSTQPIWVYGNRNGGAGALAITTDAQVFFDVEFVEAIEASA